MANNGPASSIGTPGSPITVADTLPNGESYVSAAGTGWSCTAASQVVTCGYPSNIASGTSAPMISLVVAVSSSPSVLGTVTNSAWVAPGVTADGDLANNSASDPTRIVGADLSIAKSHSGDLVAGTDGTYTLTAANAGPAASAGPITVIDTLPSGESFVSADGKGWTCSDGSGSSNAIVTCTNPSGAAARSSVAQISLVVAIGPGVTGTLTNAAEVVPGPTADPVTSNNTASDPATVVTEADLSITKTSGGRVLLGHHGTYSLAVTNNGPSVAIGPVTVTDPLPAGEAFVSAQGPGWTCTAAKDRASSQTTVTCSRPGALYPGTTAPVISLVVVVGDGAYPSVTNTARVFSPTHDPSHSDNSSSATFAPTRAPAPKIKKTPASTKVKPKPASPPSAAPSGPLPFTGFNSMRMSVDGLLLIFAGLVTLEVARRLRRPSST